MTVGLVRRLERGGEVHEPLDLDAVSGAHVRDVVEVGRRRDQLRAAVGVAASAKEAKLLLGLDRYLWNQ